MLRSMSYMLTYSRYIAQVANTAFNTNLTLPNVGIYTLHVDIFI